MHNIESDNVQPDVKTVLMANGQGTWSSAFFIVPGVTN